MDLPKTLESPLNARTVAGDLGEENTDSQGARELQIDESIECSEVLGSR
jgi:hypothetical protein